MNKKIIAADETETWTLVFEIHNKKKEPWRTEKKKIV